MSLNDISRRAIFSRKAFTASATAAAAFNVGSVTAAELKGGNALTFMMTADDPAVGVTGGTLVLQGHEIGAGASTFVNIVARDGSNVEAPDPLIFIEDGPLMNGGAIFATVPAQYLETEFYDEWRVVFTPAGAAITNLTVLAAISNPTITPHSSEEDALLSNFHKGATVTLG